MPKKTRNTQVLTCLECGYQVKGGGHMSRHIQKEHNMTYDEYKVKHGLIKTPEQLLEEGAIKCAICGEVSHDLTSHITRVHKMKCADYKTKYGNFRSQKYLQEQSERIKGDKNPAYQHGGKFSALSDNFIHADKVDKQEIIKKISKSNKESGNNNTTIRYWTRKGFTEEEAKLLISNRQKTFSLQKCIAKYGDKDGKRRWSERQKKWIESRKKSYRHGYSMISQSLFWKIASRLDSLEHIHFAELGSDKFMDATGKNNELILKLPNKVLMPDFIDASQNKILEFDGQYFHSDRFIKASNRMTDKKRDEILISHGYKILHIKEEDYIKNPEEQIQKCLEFLKSS